jgi:hypothetical protein
VRRGEDAARGGNGLEEVCWFHARKYAAAPFGLCGGKIQVVVFFGLPESGSGVGRFSIA